MALLPRSHGKLGCDPLSALNSAALPTALGALAAARRGSPAPTPAKAATLASRAPKNAFGSPNLGVLEALLAANRTGLRTPSQLLLLLLLLLLADEIADALGWLLALLNARLAEPVLPARLPLPAPSVDTLPAASSSRRPSFGAERAKYMLAASASTIMVILSRSPLAAASAAASNDCRAWCALRRATWTDSSADSTLPDEGLVDAVKFDGGRLLSWPDADACASDGEGPAESVPRGRLLWWPDADACASDGEGPAASAPRFGGLD